MHARCSQSPSRYLPNASRYLPDLPKLIIYLQSNTVFMVSSSPLKDLQMDAFGSPRIQKLPQQVPHNPQWRPNACQDDPKIPQNDTWVLPISTLRRPGASRYPSRCQNDAKILETITFSYSPTNTAQENVKRFHAANNKR